jgi:pectate lyase
VPQHSIVGRLVITFMVFCSLVSVAHAALPAGELWREAILGQHVGFGTVTGGAGGTLCTVTTLLDSGAGSLRACADFASNRWIIFQAGLTGTIQFISRGIDPGSNITIDGRGADITLTGNGRIHIDSVSNIIITNMKLSAPVFTVHNLWIVGSAHDIWLDHLTIGGGNQDDENMLIDCTTFAGGVLGVTFSWIRFIPATTNPNWPGSFVISANSGQTCNANTQLTLHHNYYDQIFRRTPFQSFAKVHSFNNYYKNTVACASPPCMAADIRNTGQFYSENDIFECGGTVCCDAPACDTVDPRYVSGRWPRVTTKNWPGDVTAVAPSNMRTTGQWSVTGTETYEADLNPGTIFTPSSLYSYTAVTANAALRDAIVAGAGWQNVTVPPGTPNAPTNLRVVSP